MKTIGLILSLVALGCVSCARSPRWVEVNSHTRQWNHLMNHEPPKTIILIKHEFFSIYSTEGPFESKVHDDESLEIPGKNVVFRDPELTYHVRVRPGNQKATGSIVLDEIKGEATISLQEEFEDSDGFVHLRRYANNGRFELRCWSVDDERRR